MTGNDIPPEHFKTALGELMEAVRPFIEVYGSIGLAAEFHQIRRFKQIKLGEIPLDHVPLGVAIATLRQLEEALINTRATLEKVDIDNRRMEKPNLYLVPGSMSKKLDKKHG